jgi:acetolactate synthase-1/2/3 large subunit
VQRTLNFLTKIKEEVIMIRNKKFEGKIQGGHLVAKSIAEKGIRKIFSLAGGFVNPIYDGCLEYGIDIIDTRNEQEAGFLADGWAQVTREPAVCIGEPSGVTNFVSAVAEAYYSQQPVIFIGVSSIFHRIQQRGFKEIPLERIVEPITKYSVLVGSGPPSVGPASRFPEYFDKAYDIAVNPPTGPVMLSIPINFLYSSRHEREVKEGERAFHRQEVKRHRLLPHPDDVDFLKEELKAAKKPVIIAGPEVYWARAEKELEDFIASAQVPTFVPPWHNPPIDFTNPANMGRADIHINPASRLIAEEADLVVFAGADIDYSLDFGEPPLFNTTQKKIAINASPRKLADNHLAIPILSDLKMLFSELKQDIDSLKADPNWIESVRARRKEDNEKTINEAKKAGKRIHPLYFCLDVLHSLGEKDYVVIDGGDIDGWFHTAVQIWSLEGKKIGGIFHSGSFHQLGVGVSYATAAKMAHPESKVVLISGDGTFGLNPGLPLETALRYNLPIVVVISNDGRWGQIQEQQKQLWGRTPGTSFRVAPYHKMIEGTGGHGEYVEDAKDFKPALERCFASGLPSVINVRVDPDLRSTITQGLVDRRERSSLE